MKVGDPGDLYGLPLDRFVPERARLVKALRGEGRREEAQRVGALPKPSMAAWAVNQLARTQTGAVADLLQAGDALSEVQSALIGGGSDARALRLAAQREREAVERLVEAARGLLSSEGRELTAATLERVADTLHAAALDEDARGRVLEGCLARELRHVGLGAGASTVGERGAAPTRRARAKPEPSARSGSARGVAEREAAEREAAEREAAEREVAERERERAARLQAAERVAADADKEAERATEWLRDTQRRHDRAADALREAKTALTAARSEAASSDRARARAREALKRLVAESDRTR